MVVVYKTLMLIKTWRPLVKPKLSAMTDDMINLLSANAHKSVLLVFLCFLASLFLLEFAFSAGLLQGRL
jgi:hypothetical protein